MRLLPTAASCGRMLQSDVSTEQKNHEMNGYLQSNSKRKKMLEVQENKSSLKYDQELVLTNVYLMEQIRGDELYKIVFDRNKVPLDALDLWRHDRMRQKDIFSEPLIHGMCTALHNTYIAEFPRTRAHGMLDVNLSPPQQRGMEGVLDLNLSPPQLRGIEGVLDLNRSPPQQRGMEGVLDLNLSPPQQRGMESVPDAEMQEQKSGLDVVPDQLNEEIQEQKNDLDVVPEQPSEEMQQQKSCLDGVPDQPDEEMLMQKQKRSLKRGFELTDVEKHGAYFALEVIKRRDGKFRTEDKQLIASLLKTSVRTIERIWRKAQDQIEIGQQVDVSNQRKGHVGRKRKDLQLSRVKTIPLNQRKTIRSLAKSLGVKRSTLHLRFKWGELKRHTNSLKPLLTEGNKIQRLQFCLDMVNEESLSSPEPTFKVMDNMVHIDEKWFIMTKERNTYYLHPEEPKPLRTVKNKNSIGKVMFLTAVARPRYGEDGGVTFDGKIGTWAFVQEIPAAKKSKNRERGTIEVKPVKVTRDVMREPGPKRNFPLNIFENN
ncbi:hypothetical protein QYE76_042154 [Lolium multiflorum]|uniref:Transposase n=1 Tax=Lolium multiflorum TaxID=4521 RepID=A0AAD8TF39_LOLMU|nr:hypothetical protein QYE76_042154 [Lolium multiflorum]